ncbi:hypothetical protein A9R05_43220 (plasmid) [Burkholderia sp. KK1]|nr:GIY-YIG nuclease family protein [Burkholderia sp. M701]AQH05824.1 hypothetical protein A9R05_43220 [Burkholderia sp. KK1]
MRKPIHLGQFSSIKDLPDTLRSRSKLDLLDHASLVPALDKLAEHGIEPRLYTALVRGRDLEYFDSHEIINLGLSIGLNFVGKGEMDPTWIDYVKVSRQVREDLEWLKKVEETHGYRAPQGELPTTPGVANAGPTSDSGAARTDTAEVDLLLHCLKSSQQAVANLTSLNSDLMLEIGKYKRAHHRALDVSFSQSFAQSIENFADGIPLPDLFAISRPMSVIRTPGVYFLFDDDGHLLYIGQSVDVPYRVRDHLRGLKEARFTRVAAVSVPENELLSVERKYIDLYAPPFNKTGKTAFEAKREKKRQISARRSNAAKEAAAVRKQRLTAAQDA